VWHAARVRIGHRFRHSGIEPVQELAMPSFDRSSTRPHASCSGRTSRLPLAFGLALAGSFASTLAATAAPTCSAQSAATAPLVVELYTSEGCSSCPPADKWLSQRMKADPSVVALAFHVDYWDRLGWKDRFASAAYTQRQAAQQRSSGARFSYTPQIIIDGADRPDWPRANASRADAAPGGAAHVTASLSRRGTTVLATVTADERAPPRLAAYWALTEDGHTSRVAAGENEGATLKHDAVVREYLPVAAWSARGAAPATLQFDPATAPSPAHAQRVNLVIVDAASGRPVQAVALGC
jgi:hypothetical protein